MLIKCSECEREISSFAAACPHCGCPMNLQTGGANKEAATLEEKTVWDNVCDMIINLDDESGAMAIIRRETGLGLADIIKITSFVKENGALPDNLPKTKSEIAKEEQLKKQPKPAVCKSCHKQISTHTEVCPNCGTQTGVHVCPKCNGIDTETISGASKATSVLLFGVFAAHKVVSKFRCKSCGHKW